MLDQSLAELGAGRSILADKGDGNDPATRPWRPLSAPRIPTVPVRARAAAQNHVLRVELIAADEAGNAKSEHGGKEPPHQD
jgi:hypothetical protein